MLHSAREAYSLATLGPEEWHGLVGRLQEEETLWETFYRHHYR